MQRARIDLSALQKPCQIAGFDFGVDENHGLLDRFLAQQLRQRTAFVVFVLNAVHRLRDVGRGGVALCGFNQNRLVLVGFGQFTNFAGEGRGKQQRLALFRQEIQNALQIGQKAHVEHAVSFVQDQILHLVQVDVALFQVIQESAGRGDE